LKVGLSKSSAVTDSAKQVAGSLFQRLQGSCLAPFSNIDPRSPLLGASPLLSMVQSPSPERGSQEIGVQGQEVVEPFDVTQEDDMEVIEGVDESILLDNADQSQDDSSQDGHSDLGDLEDHSDDVDPDYKPLTLTMEDLLQVIVYTKENCIDQMNWLLNALTPGGQKEVVKDMIENHSRNLREDNGTFIWDMFLRDIKLTLQVPEKTDDSVS
jgi:hypothetical protein